MYTTSQDNATPAPSNNGRCVLVLDTREQRVVLKSLVALGAHVTDNIRMTPPDLKVCVEMLLRHSTTTRLVMQAVGAMGAKYH